MILTFPSQAVLVDCLRVGLIPTPTLRAAAVVSVDEEAVCVEPAVALDRSVVARLGRRGVRCRRRHAGSPTTLPHWWAAVAPVRVGLEAPTARTMFSIPCAVWAKFAADLARCGTASWQYRIGDDADVYIRVAQPRLSTVFSARTLGEVYVESRPGLWVEAEYAYPLADRLELSSQSPVGVLADGSWTELPESDFVDVSARPDFVIPVQPAATVSQAETVPITVAPTLRKSRTTAAAELWVLADGVDGLYRLLSTINAVVAARLAAAIVSSRGRTIVLLRAADGHRLPPPLAIPNAAAYRRIARSPELFAPVDRTLVPILRTSALSGWLRTDRRSGRLFWLDGDGVPRVQSAPLSAFRPAAEILSYAVPDLIALDAVLAGEPFALLHAREIVEDQRDEVEIIESQSAKQGGPVVSAGQVIPRTRSVRKTPAPTTEAASAVVSYASAPQTQTAWMIERRELESAFVDVPGGPDAPERCALWPRLIEAYQHVGAHSEALLGRLALLWFDATGPGFAQQWLAAESRQWTASALDEALAQLPSSASALIAFVAYAVDIPTVPSWFSTRIARIQARLLEFEDRLPVRAVWFAHLQLSRLVGGDTLGIARLRDRMLVRLHQAGLVFGHDVPAFVGSAGQVESERASYAREFIERLKEVATTWCASHRASAPYVELLFAYAAAKLGDRERRRVWQEKATAQLDLAIVPDTTASIVKHVLHCGLTYRIEQAAGETPAASPLPASLLAELAAYTERGDAAGANNPYTMAVYVVDYLREQSRILEPMERPQSSRVFLRGSGLFSKISVLSDADPATISNESRALMRSGYGSEPLSRVRAYLLTTVLPLAPRVGEEFAIEMLQSVPALVEESRADSSPDWLEVVGEVVDRAVVLAGHFGAIDLLRRIVDRFASLVARVPLGARFTLVAAAVRSCLDVGRRFGIAAEIQALLDRLSVGVLEVQEVRTHLRAHPESTVAAIRALLVVASGRLRSDNIDAAEPVLNEALSAILNGDKLRARPRLELVCAYLSTVGDLPVRLCEARTRELFARLPYAAVSAPSTADSHFSPSALATIESAILALCGGLQVGAFGRKFRDEDEFLIRRKIHEDLRTLVE